MVHWCQHQYTCEEGSIETWGAEPRSSDRKIPSRLWTLLSPTGASAGASYRRRQSLKPWSFWLVCSVAVAVTQVKLLSGPCGFVLWRLLTPNRFLSAPDSQHATTTLTRGMRTNMLRDRCWVSYTTCERIRLFAGQSNQDTSIETEWDCIK